MKPINIGYGSYIMSNRIVSVVSPESSPIRRIVSAARDSGKLIDATFGRRTRAIIIMDSDHIALSAAQSETIAKRLEE